MYFHLIILFSLYLTLVLFVGFTYEFIIGMMILYLTYLAYARMDVYFG